MKSEKLNKKISVVSKKPGCYLWKNIQNEIIYIGKAKNLFNRINSYFSKSHNLRTQKMVSEIDDVDYVIVNSENEALILESTLINKHKPKYNVLLRENNNYPYLFLTDEPKPQLIYTRYKLKGIKGKYFGPFASSSIHSYELYKLLKNILPIQECKHKWNKECFKCEVLKRIKIPILKKGEENFKSISYLITKILNGEINQLKKYLSLKEIQFKNQLKFEEALQYLKLQKSLDETAKSQYVQINKSDLDIIAFKSNDNEIAIIIFSLIDGKLLAKSEILFEYLDEWKSSLTSFLFQHYSQAKIPSIVYIAYLDEDLKVLAKNLKINFVIPQKGKIMNWMVQAMNNASASLEKSSVRFMLYKQRTSQANDELQKILKLQKLQRIEIFDVSQFFGVNRVGAMVVYVDGLNKKKFYRKFIIKMTDNTSDIDCMQEVLYRRYQHLLKDFSNAPDLIILDGGIAHYNLLKKCLSVLELKIPFVVLTKNKNHRTESLIFQKKKIDIKKYPNVFYYLTNIQNEVHRYAINFHRKKQIKSQLYSLLKSVSGLGEKRIKLLLEKYDNNLMNLQKASTEEISQLITAKIAKELKKKLEEINDKNYFLNTTIQKI